MLDTICRKCNYRSDKSQNFKYKIYCCCHSLVLLISTVYTLFNVKHRQSTQQYQQYIKQHGGGREQGDNKSHDSSLSLLSQFAPSLPPGPLTLLSAHVQ